MSKKKKERAVIVTTEQEIGVAHCLHGHKWVSPPVVCPYCEIASLRKLRDELQIMYLAAREAMDDARRAIEFYSMAPQGVDGWGKAKKWINDFAWLDGAFGSDLPAVKRWLDERLAIARAALAESEGK